MSASNRREPRFRAQVPITLTVGKKSISATTGDISYRGLFVQTEDRPGMRQLVRVEVQLPNRPTESFQTHATVVRHGDDYGVNGVGLEFFGRTDSAQWDQFVQEVQRNPPVVNDALAAAPAATPAPFPGAPQFPGAPPGPSNAPAPSPGRRPPPAPPPGGFFPSNPSPPSPNVPVAPIASVVEPQPERISNVPPLPPPRRPQPSDPGRSPPPLPPRSPSPTGPGGPPPPAPSTSAAPSPVAPHASVGPPMGPPPIAPTPPAAPMAPPVAPPAAPAGPAAQERRRHPRIALNLEVRIRTSRSMHVAHTIDVSLGGASAAGADLALSVGEQIIVNLLKPGTILSFRVDAVVRRTLPSPYPGTFAFGFEFLPMDPTRQALFNEFLETAIPSP